MLKILSIIKIILECLTIVGPILKIPKLEKEVEIMATGIEGFSRDPSASGKGKILKKLIHDLARDSGVEDHLSKKLKKWETGLWKKIF